MLRYSLGTLMWNSFETFICLVFFWFVGPLNVFIYSLLACLHTDRKQSVKELGFKYEECAAYQFWVIVLCHIFTIVFMIFVSEVDK